MKIKSAKDSLKIFYAIFLAIPVFFTLMYFVAWRNDEGQGVLLIVLLVFWLLAIIACVAVTVDAIKKPYPFHYLVDYNTLVDYLRDEEKFAIENKLEASFHLYLYYEGKKYELNSWHYSFSSFEEEKVKGDIIYFDKEEFKSFDEFINTKLPKFDGHVLIELVNSDYVKLNEYRANHPELDVKAYIENFNANN